MARETAREVAVLEATETPIYQDQLAIVRNLGAHLTEAFIGQVAGAAGAGGDLENVPFEPALVVTLNDAGSTPTVGLFALLGAGTVGMTVAAAAAAAAADATVTQVASGNWTIGLPTGLAPDGETVTVLAFGFRDVAGSL
jgi:hypothetical protein